MGIFPLVYVIYKDGDHSHFTNEKNKDSEMVSVVIQPENAGTKIEPYICLTQVSSSLLLPPCRSHYTNPTTLQGTFSGYLGSH